MSNVTYKTRIRHKIDTSTNWALAANFVPLKGELIIYDENDGTAPQIKIGNGITTVNSLPFISATSSGGGESGGGTISGDYLPLTGGTLTGPVTLDGSDTSDHYILKTARIDASTDFTANVGNYTFKVLDKNGSLLGYNQVAVNTNNHVEYRLAAYLTAANNESGANKVGYLYSRVNKNGDTSTGSNTTFTATSVFGAIWNDYAEFRKTVASAKPGQVVIENGDGTLRLSSERLQPGCEVVSDTYGFAIGETEDCKTPIAVSGRVLAYTYENRDTFVAGEPVCSGPNGTVSRMTREEAKEYPERIIGTVSEIPNYKVWGTGNVSIDGRIWIRIR